MNDNLPRAGLRYPRVFDLRQALIGCASHAEGLLTHYEWAARQRPLIDRAADLLERAGARYVPVFESCVQHRILGLPMEGRPEWWGGFRALIGGGQDAEAADAWALLDGAARYWRATLDAIVAAEGAADAAAGELDSSVAGALNVESVAVRESLLDLRRAMHGTDVSADPDYALRRAGVYADRLRAALDGLGAWIDRLRPAAAVVVDPGDATPPALPDGIALTTDHESILAVLGKTPTKCKTVIDVASAGTIRNRETVGRLLGELAGFGMVDRPHGMRKGYALTDAGRKRLPGASPT